MCIRLTVSAAMVLLVCTANTQAIWMLLDDFEGQGPIGGDAWSQTTPMENLFMADGRLQAAGKGMALHQTFPGLGEDVRIRFEAYSGRPGAELDGSVQTVSAIVGAKDPLNHYEVRLLSDGVLSTSFYRMQFYSVLGGVAANDLTVDFQEPFDAARLEAHMHDGSVFVSVQPLERATGTAIGAPLNYGFHAVPAALADDLSAYRVGLAAHGTHVEIDNFEGFVVPEAATFFAVAFAGLFWIRPRRRTHPR